MITDIPIPTDCNEGRHFFINSEFCDKCDIDFDTWYEKVIEETRKDVCLYLLLVLQSVVNEQVSIKLLRKNTGSYLYQAVKDACTRKGWIE